MGSRVGTPPMEPSSPMDGGIRKRVCKACDRCRLKKSKCDGSSPCSRCKADNAICVFGERKKSHDKVYPKGYVEMLESQQSQLVAGLQELYRRLQTGEGWSGAPLKENGRGTPLTHDILDRLGALKHEDQSSESFEENLEILQRKLASNGAGLMQREASFDTNSDIDGSPSFEQLPMHRFPLFTNPFQQPQKFPPTPPGGSPHPQPAKASSPLKTQMPSVQQTAMNVAWQPSPVDYADSMEYNMTFDTQFNESPINMMAFQAAMYSDSAALAIAPCLTMKDWQDERYFNANMLS